MALSREEPGCISHGVFEDQMSLGTFTFVERWRDMAAVFDDAANSLAKRS